MGSAVCGNSVCRICKRKILMEEGVLFHHYLFHPRSREAKVYREMEKSWKRM